MGTALPTPENGADPRGQGPGRRVQAEAAIYTSYGRLAAAARVVANQAFSTTAAATPATPEASDTTSTATALPAAHSEAVRVR
jgi:hypothetical protein